MVWVDVEPWVAMSEPTSVLATPLQVTDPPKVGDFWLDARLTASPAGVAYLGHGRDNAPVMLVLLSDGAATDANARHRLAGEVNKMHVDTVVARGGQGQDDGRMGDRYRSEDDDPVGPDEAPLAPWVALAWDGSRAAVAEADRLLAQIDLSTTAQLGAVEGPEYKLHWLDNTEPGVTRLWPLPWPGRHDRAGWVTMAVSWLLMIALSALALLIAVLLFQNQPPQPPPPPLPTTPPPSSSQSQSPPPSSSPSSGSPSSGSPSSGSPSSGSPSSGSPSSGSPSSGSPSPSSGSASASPSSATASPDDGRNPSDSPSMESPSPGGTATGEGGPTPNKKL